MNRYQTRKKNIATGGIICMVLALLMLLTVPALCLHASGEIEAGRKTADRMLEEYTEAGVEDSVFILSLLRGGYILPKQELSMNFARQVNEYWQSNAGSYSLALENAYALSAMGIDYKEHIPNLYTVLANDEKAQEESFEVKCKLLTYIHQNNISEEILPIDTEKLVKSILDEKQSDGSFGNAEKTGIALQALSGYYAVYGAEKASENAQIWVQLNDNGQGTYGNDSEQEVVPTAEVIIAIDCLGYDPEFADYEGHSITNGLISQMAEDGSFGGKYETSVALLALSAKARHNRGQSNIYDFSDVEPFTPDFSVATGSNEDAEDAESIDGQDEENAEDDNANEITDEKVSKDISLKLMFLIAFALFTFIVIIVILVQINKNGKNKNK